MLKAKAAHAAADISDWLYEGRVFQQKYSSPLFQNDTEPVHAKGSGVPKDSGIAAGRDTAIRLKLEKESAGVLSGRPDDQRWSVGLPKEGVDSRWAASVLGGMYAVAPEEEGSYWCYTTTATVVAVVQHCFAQHWRCCPYSPVIEYPSCLAQACLLSPLYICSCRNMPAYLVQ